MARDVWSNTSVSVGDDGVINTTLRPHASVLYRVWTRLGSKQSIQRNLQKEE